MPVEDPSNADPRFLRSQVRHELIPALEAVFPGARRRLVVLAERQRRMLGAVQSERRAPIAPGEPIVDP